ncbi:extracellular matrix protein 1 isoform X2 [Hoplias malabaricus]|uniref:extracellular matrix protein 1 isoform X2 n=1 Tax=Hoplias malabaricus TaxID=27720 RepID=UPI00346219C3
MSGLYTKRQSCGVSLGKGSVSEMDTRSVLFLLLVFVVKAEEEPFLGQTEVTFDIADILDEVSPGLPGPPLFGPRSIPPKNIPFPLAQPTAINVQAICRYRHQRPRYPEDLRKTYFDYLARQANAVNQLESWFSVCCSKGNEDEGLLLCCTEQAWKKSLSAFCDVEFSIKTSHYYCCKKRGPARWQCFQKAAPDQLYQPSGNGTWADIPSLTDFNFNPKTCQNTGSMLAPRKPRKETRTQSNIFPPGRPNSDNIGSICANQNQRRTYISTCLIHKDNSWWKHQAKAVSDLEKNFSQCCKEKKARQTCAEKKWKMMLDKFCLNKKTDLKQFSCCRKQEAEEKYECFADTSPNPNYIFNNNSVSMLQSCPALEKFCEKYKIDSMLQKEVHFVFTDIINKMGQCCPRVEENLPACIQRQLDVIVDKKCRVENSFWKCCKVNPKKRNSCAAKNVLQYYFQ